MDESIQKQIEADIAKLAQPEHWVWRYTPGCGYAESTNGWCSYCEERFPQSHATCLQHHPTLEFGRPVRRAP